MLITPPSASAPYNVEDAPFTISILSTFSGNIPLKLFLPFKLIGAPLIKIRAPRSKPRIFTRLSMEP